MSWQTEMTIIVRTLINDLDPTSPTYSDARIEQVISVAGTFVQQEANLSKTYTIDVSVPSIIDDPTTPTRDESFVALTCLKAACIVDQSTYRTKAATDGIRAALGSASLQIAGNLAGFKAILDQGPCAMYQQLLNDHNIGGDGAVNVIQAVLSPFVGNNFDPRMYNRAAPGDSRDFYG
jgi:hypothetical protein